MNYVHISFSRHIQLKHLILQMTIRSTCLSNQSKIESLFIQLIHLHTHTHTYIHNDNAIFVG